MPTLNCTLLNCILKGYTLRVRFALSFTALVAVTFTHLFILTPNLAYAQDGEAATLLGKVNALRQSKGLPALTYNAVLASAAAGHSTYLATHPWSDPHTESNGSTPHSRAVAAGYPVKVIGENVVGGPNATVDWAFNWWVNSPVHYQNMLGPYYQEIGIGIADGSTGKFYTLLFGSPDTDTAGANPAPQGDSSANTAQTVSQSQPQPDKPQAQPVLPPTKVPTHRPTATPTITPSPTITYTPRASFTPTFTATFKPPTETAIVLEVSPQPKNSPTTGPQLVAVVSTPKSEIGNAIQNDVNTGRAAQTPSRPSDFLRTLIPFAIVAQVFVFGGFAANSMRRRRVKNR